MKYTTRTTFDILVFLPMVFITLICYPFAYAAPPWDQIQKMIANDGNIDDQYGSAVSVSRNLAVIGAVNGDGNVADSGCAYVFDAKTGQQILKLIATDGVVGDWFGYSVAISGNLAVVGALHGDGKATDSGSAYVFDLTTGQQLYKLIASDGEAGDFFGTSVAIYDNLAVIGAKLDDDNGSDSGSVYIFDVTTHQQLFKLLSADGSAGDYFGQSVAINNSVVVIGAVLDDDNGSLSGSAYVFDINTGQQLFKLLAADGATSDRFGTSLAVSGNLVVIGAKFDNDNGNRSGSAYIFDVTTGQQLSKLLASDGNESDEFGLTVAISGNLVVIGAPYDDDKGSESGSAYVFEISGKQLFKFIAADGVSGDQLGYSVAIDGPLSVIGAVNGDGNVGNSGSAYVFQQRNLTNLLTVNPDPLIASQDGIFTIMQARPDERTWLIYSLNGLQKKFIRQLNVVIDLANPQIVAQPRNTDAMGDLQFIIPMPGMLFPIDIWFQAVQQQNVTNYVATQIVP